MLARCIWFQQSSTAPFCDPRGLSNGRAVIGLAHPILGWKCLCSWDGVLTFVSHSLWQPRTFNESQQSVNPKNWSGVLGRGCDEAEISEEQSVENKKRTRNVVTRAVPCLHCVTLRAARAQGPRTAWKDRWDGLPRDRTAHDTVCTYILCPVSLRPSYIHCPVSLRPSDVGFRRAEDVCQIPGCDAWTSSKCQEVNVKWERIGREQQTCEPARFWGSLTLEIAERER